MTFQVHFNNMNSLHYKLTECLNEVRILLHLLKFHLWICNIILHSNSLHSGRILLNKSYIFTKFRTLIRDTLKYCYRQLKKYVFSICQKNIWNYLQIDYIIVKFGKCKNIYIYKRKYYNFPNVSKQNVYTPKYNIYINMSVEVKTLLYIKL